MRGLSLLLDSIPNALATQNCGITGINSVQNESASASDRQLECTPEPAKGRWPEAHVIAALVQCTI